MERAWQEACVQGCPGPFVVWGFFLFKHFIYLFMRDTGRERHRHRQREKQAPGREPDAGLDPRILGSCPGLKSGIQPLSHPGGPALNALKGDESLGGSAADRLSFAQVVIPGSWDRVPHQAPCEEPASPSACVSASHCVSIMNK